MGSPAIFSGNFVKLLKDSLDFFGGAQALSKAVDPTVTATTARKGSVLFSTLTGQHYRKLDSGSSTNWEPLTAGGLWARQYVKNFRGDSGTTGYVTYDDGASSRPVDGTGGSPSAVTISTTGTNPLSGVTSMLLSKSAADGQGEGVSYDIAIDRADRGKVMRLALKYEIASGTYSGGTSSTDSDVIAYLYRVDATARLIEPVPFKLNGGVVGQQYELNAEFQTDTDATNYRLILHVATTSASAYTMKFEWQLSTVLASSGPQMTDWTAFTPTGSWTTNVTYTGFYRRVGDTAHVRVGIALSGAPDSTNLTINLPSGLSIDTAKVTAMVTTSGAAADLGTFSALDAGVSNYIGMVGYNSTTSIFCYRHVVSGSQIIPGVVNATNPFTWGSGDYLEAVFVVPIAGWGSGQVSADAGSRTVALYAHTLSTTSQVANTAAIFTTATRDTHAGYNASTGEYTVQAAGDYVVSAGGTYSSSGNSNFHVSVNGSSVVANFYSILSSGNRGSGSVVVPSLKAGDKITVVPESTYTAGDTGGYIAILRIAGPEQIVASEKVYLDAYRSSNQSVNDSTQTTIVIDTVLNDSHAALNTSTGVWTAPRADFYTITGKLRFASNSTGTRSLRVRKNGSASLMELQIQAHPTGITTISDTRSVYLLQGDTIELRALQDSGGSLNVNGGSADTYLTISGQ